MDKPEFEDAYSKLERASHHLSDLAIQVSNFLAEKPFSLVIDRNFKECAHFACLKINKNIPKNIALVVGDALHNIRSSLDAAYYAAIDKSGMNENELYSIQFPINPRCNSIDDFKNNAKSKKINKCKDKVKEAIYKSKPFSGGNEYLCSLHRFNIIDKHRLLIPTCHTAMLKASEWRKVHPMFEVFEGNGTLSFPARNGRFGTQKQTFEREIDKWRAKWGEEEALFQPNFCLSFIDDKTETSGDICLVIEKFIFEAKEVIDAISSAYYAE